MLILSPPYSLRPMVVADIPAVLAIDRLSFPSPGNERLYFHELVDNQLAHYQVLLGRSGEGHEDEGHADGGDRIIGYAGYWLIADEVHISTIAVHPEARGRGYGEWLFLSMLLMACELYPLLVTLEVRRSNTVAQALYRKYRFVEVGMRRRYYRDTGEDALLMTVDFAEQPDYCQWLAGQAEALGARPAAD